MLPCATIVSVTFDDKAPILVVGLGNPGPRYETTRHNIGFLTADELVGNAAPMPGNFGMDKRAQALTCEIRVGDRKVIVAKPQTFMNLSGGPTSSLCRFFKIPAGNVIVIHDELDLDFGTIRLKKGGGDNGHNGLKDITKALATSDYHRVRCGIGRPPGRMAAADYVLKPFTGRQAQELGIVTGDASDAVELLVTQGLAVAQNQVHAN